MQLKVIFLQWLPWILRMHRPGRMKLTRKTIMLNSKMRNLELKERSSRSLLANVLDIDDDLRHQPALTYNSGSIGMRITGNSIDDSSSSYQSCVGAQRELMMILKELRYITAKMRKQEEDQDTISDWKFAAMVVDRFCLIVFTLFTIVATITVLCSAPHIIVQ